MTDYTINDRNGETRIEGTITPDPFSGGTITGAQTIAPTDKDAVALTLRPAVGAASDGTDTVEVYDETGALMGLWDATSNLFAGLSVANGGRFTITAGDIFSGERLLNADGGTSAVTIGSGAGTTVELSGGALDTSGGGGTKKVGFFGTAPVVKPTVTGSKAGNAALASLITALAAFGILTDSTS